MHSCAPNLLFLRRPGDVMAFVALRDITEGETLSFSYIASRTLIESNARRRKQLLSANLFTCACSRCRGVDLTRGLLTTATTHGKKMTALWHGPYESNLIDDPTLPLVRVMSDPNDTNKKNNNNKKGWYSTTTAVPSFDLPLEAERGLEAAYDQINTDECVRVENKYHNLKAVLLGVWKHLGDAHWLAPQLYKLLSKYHRTMALAIAKLDPTSELAILSQCLSVRYGEAYLDWIEKVLNNNENSDVAQLLASLWRVTLGQGCEGHVLPGFESDALRFYSDSLSFLASVYGEDEEQVLEIASKIAGLKQMTGGNGSNNNRNPFFASVPIVCAETPEVLFELWEATLRKAAELAHKASESVSAQNRTEQNSNEETAAVKNTTAAPTTTTDELE
eukprot:PhM_4_TR7700/c0_g1_i1/m.60288